MIATLVEVRPDVVHLMGGLDHDIEGHALGALQQALTEAGLDYTHAFSAQPNSGLPTGLDMDGDGALGEARDAQGYGRFTGDSGMAVLSRHPIGGGVQDFSTFLWADLPGAIPPLVDGQPFPSAEAFAAQRLSSVGHWDVEVLTPDGSLRLLAFAAGTPLYDGDEDRNGRRNHDEITFWARYLDGDLPWPAPPLQPVVVLGGRANADPFDGGAGRLDGIRALLDHPRLQDPPEPRSTGGAAQATPPGHRGDPALDTADFKDPRPGNLRLDYVLPDTRLSVVDSGVSGPRAARNATIWSGWTSPCPDHPLTPPARKALPNAGRSFQRRNAPPMTNPPSLLILAGDGIAPPKSWPRCARSSTGSVISAT